MIHLCLGARHAYSNFGYEVLGRIIEQISGQSYAEYMQDMLAEAEIYGMKLGRTKKEDTEPDEVR